jgi:hypothetical protein
MGEVWKPIPGYDGHEVSDQGRVRSVDRWLTNALGHRRFYRGRVLRPQKGPGGYSIVHLSFKEMTKYIHHLVMSAFKGPTPDGQEILHNDGNKANPRLSNLRFGTRKENMDDARLHAIMVVVDTHRWIWPED